MGIFIGMIMIYHFLMMICMRDKLSKKEIDWTDKSLHLTVFPQNFCTFLRVFAPVRTPAARYGVLGIQTSGARAEPACDYLGLLCYN